MSGPLVGPEAAHIATEPLFERAKERFATLGLRCSFVAPSEAIPEEPANGVRMLLPVQHRQDTLGTLIVRPTDTGPDPKAAADSLEQLRPMLSAMIDDWVSLAELDNDVADLAEQMTDAYETLELMYSLGSSMAALDAPERFLAHTCARVRETLGFGYVAVHLPASADVGPSLAGRTHWSGDTKGETDPERLDRLLTLLNNTGYSLEAFNGPQAVVRPLRNDTGVVGLIVAGEKCRQGGNVSSYDTKLIDAVAGMLSTFLTNARLYNEQREMAIGVLESLSNAIDAKDPYTRGHALRVAYLSEQIALALGFDHAKAERLRVAGLLHDVGKIGVAEAVLQKSGKLTDAEYDQIKQHPGIGHRILNGLRGLEDILPAVLHHHERMDGRGYPAGLEGDAIPLNARIVAAADTFDAMSSTRS
ncbi:MAG: HD-GYP domain-containing protein, partial [Planctomycetota bacterium]